MSAKIGNVPAEANAKGSTNESVGADVRNPGPVSEVGSGPVRGDADSYLPATYAVKSGVRKDN